ncbi:MAG: helix-turn-helix transcriptional regulator [Kiritimatiellia bacterium]
MRRYETKNQGLVFELRRALAGHRRRQVQAGGRWKTQGRKRQAHGGRTALYLRSATEFMEKNLSCPIRISDVARHVGIDRTHLSRLFKQHLNTSPEQVLIRLRMKAAAVLLARPDVRVKEVACSVGYNDPLYFSRMFRQVYGLSPEHHRRRIQ